LHANSADEVGIDLGPIGPADLATEESADEILRGAARRWEWLSTRVPTTVWFQHLPANLRRDEVLSQILGSGVEMQVRAAAERPVAVSREVTFSL
jgi:hypothetical protein